jgi:hypothetical protein
MAHDKQLAAKVVKLLYSVKKIDFHLGGLHISADGLAKVACEVGQAHIQVIKNSSLGSDAQYNSKTDTISIKAPNFNDAEFKSLIVHESVHALVDIVKAKGTRRLAGEAAAYLAQAIYLWHEIGGVRLKNAVKQRLRSTKAVDRQLGGIYQACLNLIQNYRLSTRTVWLPPLLYKPLLTAIKKHGVYRLIPWNQKVHANGIKAHATQGCKCVAMSAFRMQGPSGLAGSQDSSGNDSSEKPGPWGIA